MRAACTPGVCLVSLVLHGGLVEADARELRGEGLDLRAQRRDGGVLLRAVSVRVRLRVRLRVRVRVRVLGLGLGLGF